MQRGPAADIYLGFSERGANQRRWLDGGHAGQERYPVTERIVVQDVAGRPASDAHVIRGVYLARNYRVTSPVINSPDGPVSESRQSVIANIIRTRGYLEKS